MCPPKQLISCFATINEAELDNILLLPFFSSVFWTFLGQQFFPFFLMSKSYITIYIYYIYVCVCIYVFPIFCFNIFEFYDFPTHSFIQHPSCAMLCLVTQSCPTFCKPMDCSPPGSSVHGDSLGKNTGLGCPLSSRGSSQLRGWTQVSHIAGRFFTDYTTREAQEYWSE